MFFSRVFSHVSSHVQRPELNRTGFVVAAYLMTRRDVAHWKDAGAAQREARSAGKRKWLCHRVPPESIGKSI